MNKNQQKQRSINLISGFLSISIFAFIFFTLFRLKPRMLGFERLTKLDENLLTAVGFGLLIILGFYLLSLWQFIRYMRQAEEIKPIPLLMIISGVLSLLFVFSDIALLSDIHKQYRYNLAQPEWALVFPIMIFQFIIAVWFLVMHLMGRYTASKEHYAVRDSNVFLIVQYVGIITGVMGLILAGLGFIYRTGWNFTVHGIIGGAVLLFPYILAVMYWFVTKFQEKDRLWFDEKQSQDVGKSALLTLFTNTSLLLILFFSHIWHPDSRIYLLWLPLYLFATIFLFSAGNLYFSKKDL
jgi:hypothetical protein